jgi:hypothetical protein
MFGGLGLHDVVMLVGSVDMTLYQYVDFRV